MITDSVVPITSDKDDFIIVNSEERHIGNDDDDDKLKCITTNNDSADIANARTSTSATDNITPENKVQGIKAILNPETALHSIREPPYGNSIAAAAAAANPTTVDGFTDVSEVTVNAVTVDVNNISIETATVSAIPIEVIPPKKTSVAISDSACAIAITEGKPEADSLKAADGVAHEKGQIKTVPVINAATTVVPNPAPAPISDQNGKYRNDPVPGILPGWKVMRLFGTDAERNQAFFIKAALKMPLKSSIIIMAVRSRYNKWIAIEKDLQKKIEANVSIYDGLQPHVIFNLNNVVKEPKSCLMYIEENDVSDTWAVSFISTAFRHSTHARLIQVVDPADRISQWINYESDIDLIIESNSKLLKLNVEKHWICEKEQEAMKANINDGDGIFYNKSSGQYKLLSSVMDL